MHKAQSPIYIASILMLKPYEVSEKAIPFAVQVKKPVTT